MHLSRAGETAGWDDWGETGGFDERVAASVQNMTQEVQVPERIRLAVVAGDGIGPEVVEQGLLALEKASPAANAPVPAIGRLLTAKAAFVPYHHMMCDAGAMSTSAKSGLTENLITSAMTRSIGMAARIVGIGDLNIIAAASAIHVQMRSAGIVLGESGFMVALRDLVYDPYTAARQSRSLNLLTPASRRS